MADTGFQNVNTGESLSGSGSSWSNPGNITDGSDSTSAQSSVDKSDYSNYLRGTNLGFSIPGGATIDGIEVQIRHSGGGGDLEDENVYLCYGGSVISGCDNKATGAPSWSGSLETYQYGGSDNTWNCTLTASMLNSSSFGAQLMVHNTYALNSRTAYVYWIKIKVYYTESGGSNIKSIAGVAQASIKSIAGVAEANVKSVAEVSN